MDQIFREIGISVETTEHVLKKLTEKNVSRIDLFVHFTDEELIELGFKNAFFPDLLAIRKYIADKKNENLAQIIAEKLQGQDRKTTLGKFFLPPGCSRSCVACSFINDNLLMDILYYIIIYSYVY